MGGIEIGRGDPKGLGSDGEVAGRPANLAAESVRHARAWQAEKFAKACARNAVGKEQLLDGEADGGVEAFESWNSG